MTADPKDFGYTGKHTSQMLAGRELEYSKFDLSGGAPLI